MTVLVTGAAGFIGFHTARALLARGEEVVGLDNLDPYYDVALKEARLAGLRERPGFRFVRADLADRATIAALFAAERFDRVVHLAAQAGVRYSLQNPHAYVDANLAGFLNVLEGCRHGQVAHTVFASSSSVYGANTALPFSVDQPADHPVSLYAATKRANELMAHTYAHLYRLPMTGLRFFTVYGPWGRPDMAVYMFTAAILAGRPITVHNHGRLARDFTYIDDVVEGVVRTLDRVATPDPAWTGDRPAIATSSAPYRLYDIGNHAPVAVLDLVAAIEAATGRRAIVELGPMQPGDVLATCADVTALREAVGFEPSTPIADGVARFVAWYRGYVNREP
jgi:UDP-glucuronate 4-epimerase